MMKTLSVYIKSLIDFVVLKILQFRSASVEKISNNILFINTGQIGDLVVSGKVFENDIVLDKYDNSYFLLRQEFAELFDDYEGKIKIIKFNESKYKYNFFYRLKFTTQLSRYNIKTVYNLTSARSTWNDTLALAIGADEIYSYKNNWKSVKKVFESYTEGLYTSHIAVEFFNEYDRVDYLVKKLGKKNNIKKEISTSAFSLSNHSELYDIIIAPFSFLENRDFSVDDIEKMATNFSDKKILVISSKTEAKKIEPLKKYTNVVLGAGKFKLNELFSVIDNSKVFVGLDSGITHIALKTNAKIVALIGGGNYGRYLPKPNDNENIYLSDSLDCFGCEWNCTEEKFFCVENISIEKVNNEIDNLLSSYENS